MVVVDVAVFLELAEGPLVRVDVVEQADFVELFAHELAVLLTHQRRHAGVGVDDLTGLGVENEDAVPGGLEQPAVGSSESLRAC